MLPARLCLACWGPPDAWVLVRACCFIPGELVHDPAAGAPPKLTSHEGEAGGERVLSPAGARCGEDTPVHCHWSLEAAAGFRIIL